MKPHRMTFVLIFSAMFLLTFYSNCSKLPVGMSPNGGFMPVPGDMLDKLPIHNPIQDSTDTGNPDDDTGGGGDNDSALFASMAVEQACAKLDECGQPDLTGCEEEILESNKTPARLGLNPSYFNSHNDVKKAEKEKRIHPHAERSPLCLSDISSLSCTSPEVQAALESSSEIHQLIPLSVGCLGSYEESSSNGNSTTAGKKKRPPRKDK